MSLALNVSVNVNPRRVSLSTAMTSSPRSSPRSPPPPPPPSVTRMRSTYGDTNHCSSAVVNTPNPSTTAHIVNFAPLARSGEASSRSSGVPHSVAASDAMDSIFTLRTVSARCASYVEEEEEDAVDGRSSSSSFSSVAATAVDSAAAEADADARANRRRHREIAAALTRARDGDGDARVGSSSSPRSPLDGLRNERLDGAQSDDDATRGSDPARETKKLADDG
eukprot:31133-Pelagococcus_subviridis.AAC.4